MAKHLRKFENEAAYSAATIYTPSVSLIEDTEAVIFDPAHDYSQDYFTYVALGDNLELIWTGDVSGNCLSYSTDNGSTWSEPSSSFTVTLANSGDTIMFKGSGMKTAPNHPIGRLKPTEFVVDYKVQGNIMSLLFGDNFVNQTDLTGYAGAFSGFFQFSKTAPNTRLLSVENLVLPATTLAQNCYSTMFNRCTNLTTAPILPATTLATECYQNMFKGCSSLNNVTCLATDITASYCTRDWLNGVNGVVSSGTFTKAANMNDWTTGTSGIPSGWTVVDYTG